MYSFALALCSNLAFEAPSLVPSFQVGMQTDAKYYHSEEWEREKLNVR